MKVSGWVCGSCAAVGIENLGGQKSALHAMVTFCKGAGIKKTKLMYSNEEPQYPKSIESHFVFIAGPENKEASTSRPWLKYGTEFARYIRTNKLGKVVTTGKILNYKYHSETTCQVWVWQPNLNALIGWWESRIADGTIDATGKFLGPPQPKDTCLNCGYYYDQHLETKKCPHTSYNTEWAA